MHHIGITALQPLSCYSTYRRHYSAVTLQERLLLDMRQPTQQALALRLTRIISPCRSVKTLDLPTAAVEVNDSACVFAAPSRGKRGIRKPTVRNCFSRCKGVLTLRYRWDICINQVNHRKRNTNASQLPGWAKGFLLSQAWFVRKLVRKPAASQTRCSPSVAQSCSMNSWFPLFPHKPCDENHTVTEEKRFSKTSECLFRFAFCPLICTPNAFGVIGAQIRCRQPTPQDCKGQQATKPRKAN